MTDKTQNDYSVTTLELSHSTMAKAKSCLRKLEFSKLYGYNVYSESLSGAAGQALHEAIGAYLSTRNKAYAIWILIKSYPVHLCTNPMWNWSLENCYGMLLAQIDYFTEHTEYEVAIIDGKPAIEVGFEINLKHNIENFLPVKYRGYIDLIVYNRLTDTYLVIDFKNTGVELDDYTPMFKYNSQVLPYSLILAALLNKPFDTLEVQYLVCKNSFLDRRVIPVDNGLTKADIQDWATYMYHWLRYISGYYKAQWFPRTADNCIHYSRECPFFELCQSRKPNTIKEYLSMKEKVQPKQMDIWVTLELELK